MRNIIKVAAVTAVAILVVATGVATYAYLMADHETLEVEHRVQTS
ncbi:MAG: hypothetical protein ACI38Y_07160 [Candidatus Methanomethylophilaceae archaeon]